MPAVPSRLAPGVNFFDIPNRLAVAVGTGTVPLVMTYTRDVARFVVASLSLEKWELRSYIVGDRKSWHQVVEILGNITGKFSTPFSGTLGGDQYDAMAKHWNGTFAIS